jgi:hypothetical protein
MPDRMFVNFNTKTFFKTYEGIYLKTFESSDCKSNETKEIVLVDRLLTSLSIETDVKLLIAV